MQGHIEQSNHDRYPVGTRIRFCFQKNVLYFYRFYFFKFVHKLDHLTILPDLQTSKKMDIKFFDTKHGGFVNLVIRLK